MATKRSVVWGIAVCIALLLLLPGWGPRAAAYPLTEACGPGCTSVLTCNVVGTTTACTETCSCPGGGGTPGGGTPVGTPFPVTPRPTPTPLPPNAMRFCASYDCAPGETRPILVTFLCVGQFCQVIGMSYLGDCCDAPCTCPAEPTGEEPQPCVPGPTTTCADEWGASVSASLPVWFADRLPYPRTLVTLGASFWTSDANGRPTTRLPVEEVWGAPVDPGGDDCACRATGNCEASSPPAGTICDYKLGLKAEPVPNTPPTWSCEDDGGGVGFLASCMWDFSSAGKEYLGRGVNCEPLPAFAVTASVPYWWSLGRQWEQWEEIGACDADTCGCRVCEDPLGCSDRCDCHGDGSLCTGSDEFCGCDPSYGWVHHGPDWQLLDLRAYGYLTSYVLNPFVQLAPYRACGPHPTGVLYVPCIEVQGVISNPKEP